MEDEKEREEKREIKGVTDESDARRAGNYMV